MNNEKLDQQRYYTSKEVCARLDIADSTLRKWSISLEKNGYDFARGEQNRRLFLENDLIALDHLKSLIQGKKMSLENASIIVASRFVNNRSSTGTPSVRAESAHNNGDSPALAKLTEHITQQEQFNQELLKRLDEQNKYINNRLDQRDKNLVETMNALLESRKEQIKLLEEVKDEQKKSFFSRLFGKK